MVFFVQSGKNLSENYAIWLKKPIIILSWFIIISFLALVNVKTSHSANLRWTIKNLTTSMPHRAAPVYFYNAINERYLWWRGQCHYNSGKWKKQSSNLVGICPYMECHRKGACRLWGFIATKLCAKLREAAWNWNHFVPSTLTLRTEIVKWESFWNQWDNGGFSSFEISVY